MLNEFIIRLSGALIIQIIGISRVIVVVQLF
jgi:hypothetical protein